MFRAQRECQVQISGVEPFREAFTSETLAEGARLALSPPYRYADLSTPKGDFVTTAHTETAQPVSYRRLGVGALVAAVGAVLVNVGLYFAGRALGAFPPSVQVQGEPFSVIPVVIFSFVPVLVAALVFALLARFVARPKRVFYIVAVVVFVLMFFTPFTIPAAPAVTVVVLELMHVVVAAAALWAVRRA